MENQNKYIQIESLRKQKDFPLENNGNFQNILKLLTEQRAKIDEMLVKTRNYQVSRQRITRTGNGNGKEPEQIDDINFLEDISGYQNGASQTVEELRKKIDTLKKRHKSEVSGHNSESNNQQQQILKKKNVQTPAYKHTQSNYISPKKERLGATQESSKQPISNYLKDYELNLPSSNKNQQRTNLGQQNNSINNGNEETQFETNQVNNFKQMSKDHRSPSIANSMNINQNGIYPQQSNSPESISLPPIQQNLNQSVDLPRRNHRSSSTQYKKYGSTFNREALNKSDLGMQQNTDEEDFYNNTLPSDNNYHHYIPNSISNTRTMRLNTNQRNALNKVDNYQQRYKQNMKSKQIKKIYLQNPTPHKAQYFNFNTNLSPEKKEFRESFLNDMNRNVFNNNINSKPRKKKKGLTSQKKSSKIAILDQDIFNLHKHNNSIPSLDINPTDFTYFNNNSQAIVNTNYDDNLPGSIPQGLNCMNYYNDFESLIKRQSMETLSILEYVFDTSKSKSKPELLEKLSEFKQNFTLHAEKQDKQIREVKKKYHHFRKFDLPKDFDLGNSTF